MFLTPERMPSADVLIQKWPEEAIAELEPDHQTAVVVLTHDDKFDEPALKAALESEAFYVGALGSRRTTERRRGRLLEAGVPEEQLDRIMGPVRPRHRRRHAGGDGARDPRRDPRRARRAGRRAAARVEEPDPRRGGVDAAMSVAELGRELVAGDLKPARRSLSVASARRRRVPELRGRAASHSGSSRSDARSVPRLARERGDDPDAAPAAAAAGTPPSRAAHASAR